MKFRKKTIYILASILIILIAVAAFLYLYSIKKTSTEQKPIEQEEEIDGYVDGEGYLYYPLYRGAINFTRMNHSENADFVVSKIIYQSRRGKIYGLLVLPKKTKSPFLPAVVLIPGAGVSKESELPQAKEIAKMGYAVLTIDQRGVGETKEQIPTLEQDFEIFASKKEPYSHLVIYDALRAYDLLRGAPFIDRDNIIMAGESIGGRIAIIASVIDDSIKGTLAISTAGYQFNSSGNIYADAFLNSINPDHYVNYIAPRKLAMIHNVHDKNIKYGSAFRTFDIANDPKKFYTINTTACNHGYCDEMKDEIEQALRYVIS